MKTPTPALLVNTVADNHTPTRLLRPAVVADRLGLSIPTIWRMRRRGDFPEPIRVSRGTVAWLESDVEKWIDARRAAKRETAERV